MDKPKEIWWCRLVTDTSNCEVLTMRPNTNCCDDDDTCNYDDKPCDSVKGTITWEKN